MVYPGPPKTHAYRHRLLFSFSTQHTHSTVAALAGADSSWAVIPNDGTFAPSLTPGVKITLDPAIASKAAAEELSANVTEAAPLGTAPSAEASAETAPPELVLPESFEVAAQAAVVEQLLAETSEEAVLPEPSVPEPSEVAAQAEADVEQLLAEASAASALPESVLPEPSDVSAQAEAVVEQLLAEASAASALPESVLPDPSDVSAQAEAVGQQLLAEASAETALPASVLPELLEMEAQAEAVLEQLLAEPSRKAVSPRPSVPEPSEVAAQAEAVVEEILEEAEMLPQLQTFLSQAELDPAYTTVDPAAAAEAAAGALSTEAEAASPDAAELSSVEIPAQPTSFVPSDMVAQTASVMDQLSRLELALQSILEEAGEDSGTDADAAELPELSSAAESMLATALSDEPQEANSSPVASGSAALQQASPPADIGTSAYLADDLGISPSPAASTGFRAIPDPEPNLASPPADVSGLRAIPAASVASFASLSNAEYLSAFVRKQTDVNAPLSASAATFAQLSNAEYLRSFIRKQTDVDAPQSPSPSTEEASALLGAEALVQPSAPAGPPLEAGDVAASNVASDARLSAQTESTISAGVDAALQASATPSSGASWDVPAATPSRAAVSDELGDQDIGGADAHKGTDAELSSQSFTGTHLHTVYEPYSRPAGNWQSQLAFYKHVTFQCAVSWYSHTYHA